MDNLIQITEQDGNKAVSARELHSFLEIKTDVIIWCKRMFEYGFDENKDYIVINFENPVNKQVTIKDFVLTLDTAKEISMLQRTEKGKEARQYFIEAEKRLKSVVPELSRKQLALMVIEQEERLETLQIENNRMKPRSEFVDKVFNTDALIDIGEVAKILNLPYGRNTLFNVLREKGIFFKNKNEPFQQYVNKGYFELKEKLHEVSEEKVFLTTRTYATQKGLGFIAKILEVIEIPSSSIKSLSA